MNENFLSVQENLNATAEEMCEIAKNGFKSSFLDEKSKEDFCKEIDEILKNY